MAKNQDSIVGQGSGSIGKARNAKRQNTRNITKIAVLVALSVVSNIFTVQILNTSNTASLVIVPSFFSGIFFGPAGGAAVGFLGDLLGHFIAPKGQFSFLISASSLLFGLIPGLIFRIFKKGNSTLKITVSVILCYFICTAGLNTLQMFLWFGKGKDYWTYLSVRLPFQTLNLVANYIIVLVLYESSVLHKAFGDTKFILKKTKK